MMYLPIEDRAVQLLRDKGFEPVRIGQPRTGETFIKQRSDIDGTWDLKATFYSLIVEKIHKLPNACWRVP